MKGPGTSAGIPDGNGQSPACRPGDRGDTA